MLSRCFKKRGKTTRIK